MKFTVRAEEAPVAEPVSLSDVYDFLRLDPEGSPQTHPHDTMLASQITAARQWAESYTRRSFMQQTNILVADRFPSNFIPYARAVHRAFNDDLDYKPEYLELLRPPLVAVISVQYYDSSNVLQTLSAADYFVTEDTLPPTLNVADGVNWPETYPRKDAVQVRYLCGYDAGSPSDGTLVPAPIKQAILIGVQLQYDELAVDKREALKVLRENLLEMYRVRTF